MVAVSKKKLDINNKYLGRLADIKIRVPSDEENIKNKDEHYNN